MSESGCPFCSLSKERIYLENNNSLAIFDAYPLSLGHTLIIPKRHCQSYFDLTASELDSSTQLLRRAKQSIDLTHAPSGYNIGINDGPAAGQTVAHCHIHLIPRYHGDQHDPRGGIRWIFPDKASYWKQ